MGNGQGSAHYKMILVNYLEPAIYCMAGVDSQDGMSAILNHREREGWAALGKGLDGESRDSPIREVTDSGGLRLSRTALFENAGI